MKANADALRKAKAWICAKRSKDEHGHGTVVLRPKLYVPTDRE